MLATLGEESKIDQRILRIQTQIKRLGDQAGLVLECIQCNISGSIEKGEEIIKTLEKLSEEKNRLIDFRRSLMKREMFNEKKIIQN